MATAYDFILTGDQNTGRDRTVEALTAAGFEATRNPDGNLTATRGSLGKTLMLGAMAGKNFHVQFPVAFYSDPEGRLIVRLSRNLASGVKGGAIGVNMTNNAFIKTSEQLNQAFQAAGLLHSSVAHE